MNFLKIEETDCQTLKWRVGHHIQENHFGNGKLKNGQVTPEQLKSAERIMREGYIKHNLYVAHIVPKEDLLIWNLKDGWAPLCNFLNKPIPSNPIPHDNRGGDTDKGSTIFYFEV